jgi:hypothetical protein
VGELFSGWTEHPPTNILVKALVDGFGGMKRSTTIDEELVIPKQAQDALQAGAVSAIASKADPRWLPVVRGKDPGLSQTKPVFDTQELRRRSTDALRKRKLKEDGGK